MADCAVVTEQNNELFPIDSISIDRHNISLTSTSLHNTKPGNKLAELLNCEFDDNSLCNYRLVGFDRLRPSSRALWYLKPSGIKGREGYKVERIQTGWIVDYLS